MMISFFKTEWMGMVRTHISNKLKFNSVCSCVIYYWNAGLTNYRPLQIPENHTSPFPFRRWIVSFQDTKFSLISRKCNDLSGCSFWTFFNSKYCFSFIIITVLEGDVSHSAQSSWPTWFLIHGGVLSILFPLC